MIRWVLAAVLLCSAPLAAQTIRGTASTTDGATPVPGVVVLLLDSTGTTVRRALTDERGAFVIGAPAPGRYAVRALRIGFRPTNVANITLGSGETRPLALRLSGVVTVLERVLVSAERGCRTPADAGRAAADLWEAARTALLAQQLTAASRGYDMRWLTGDRWYDLGKRIPNRQRLEVHRGSTVRAFASLPADSLAAIGYAYTVKGGDIVFHGPDADVLLSDRFARDHCFSVVASDDPAQTLVGLAFRPPERRQDTLVDVSGTLWIDRATSELRHIEFAYVGLPATHPDVGRGRVDYMRLPTGGWIIRNWSIRMPVMSALAMSDGEIARLTRRRGVRISEAQVATGEVTDVRLVGGRMLWSSRTARIEGSVPAALAKNARVRLIDGVSPIRPLPVQPDGRFAADSIARGPYRLVVGFASIDSLGLAMDTIAVVADSVTPPVVRIDAPSPSAIVRRLCQSEARDSAARAIVGVVRSANGTPSSRARVLATWQEGRVRDGRATLRTLERGAQADGAGRYVLCDLPTDKTIQLRADDRRALSAVPTVTLSPVKAYHGVDLRLGEVPR